MKHKNSNVAGRMNARIAMCMICSIADSYDLNRILEQENKEEKHNENAAYKNQSLRRKRTCDQIRGYRLCPCGLYGRYGRDKVRTKNDNGKVCFIPAVQAMEPFTAHQLRHSYATMLYDADVDVKTAQKLLGHADFSVTMKIYTHLSTEKESAGIERLNQHVTEHLGNRIEVLAKER